MFIASLWDKPIAGDPLVERRLVLNPWRTSGFSIYKFWGVALVYMYFQYPADGAHHHASAAMVYVNRGAKPLKIWARRRGPYWRFVGIPVLMPSVLGSTLLPLR